MHSRSFNILGTGEYRPEYVVPSHYLDGTLKLPDGSVEKKSGVESRRWSDYGRETTSFMGASAARQALEAAGISADDVDCIISAGGTVERAIPCTAVLIQRELGLSASTIPCFDINSTCLSFLTALDTASALLEVGRFKRILIVSSDIPSLGLNPEHLESYSIFGDGAAAAVIGKGSERGSVEVIASHMETYSSAAEVCNVRAGGTAMHPCREVLEYEEFVAASRFSMDGKAAYKVSAEHIEGFVSSLFQGTGLGIAEMDLVVPHQASMLAMHHLRKKLGIVEDRLVDIFADHGNQVAASIPTALHTAITQARIKPGNRVLLIGTGAGISIAGMVLSFK